MGLQFETAGAAARRRAQESSKEATVARLLQVDAQINEVRASLAANPANARLQRRLETLLTESDALSAQLGGDRAPSNLFGLGGRQRGAVTPVPPGCTAGTTTGANATPVAIPDNSAVGVSSTITIAGAGTYMWDVDLQTFITHTFPGDIDMTLTSPAGTVVTVSTDNGGSSDDAFNGTVWTDDAGASNAPGPANDNVFAVGVVETPLAPEEAMASLRGENPNGVWTLFLADDAGQDTGSLNSWNLNITTLASAPMDAAPITGTNATPAAIPDNSAVGVTQTITIAGGGAICDLDLTTFITHTFPGDIDMTLTSPAGTVVTVSTDNGGSSDDAFNGTVWDDDAGATNAPGPAGDNVFAVGVVETPLCPEEPFAAFRGENPNGVWTLFLADDAGQDTGSLNSWSLSIVTCQCMVVAGCAITCPTDQVVTATSPDGAVVNYPAPTSTGNCGTITCTPASGSSFPVGTTAVTCSESTGTTSTTTVYSSGNVAVPVPASGSVGAMTPQVINIADPGTVTDVNLRVRLNHTFDGDLSISLTSPGGATVNVMNAIGGSGDNLGTGGTDCSGTKTVFDDEAATPIASGAAPFAGSFIPGSPLTAIDGGTATGAWTLNITDLVSGDSGTLFCWELEITRDVPTPGQACSFNVTVGIPFDGCCVDDFSGDTFQQVVASVPSTSPLFGFWQYTVASTGEVFTGNASVAYRPGLSLIMRDTDDPAVALYAQIDYTRRTCLVQVTDRTTNRQFTLRDRNITNSTCTPIMPGAQ